MLPENEHSPVALRFPIPTSPDRQRLLGLEAGRGLAALLVLLFHVSRIIAQPRFYGELPWDGVFEKFDAGVDFFFVLSGFIIAWVHWSDIGVPNRLSHYAVRRFLRIYPPYWAVLFPLSFAYFLFPSAGLPSQHDTANFFASFFLFPYPEQPVVGVAWTLVREVIFYFLFGLLIVFGRRMFLVLAGWSIGIVGANIAFGELTYPLSIFLDAHNIEFIMGMGAAFWARYLPVTFPRLLTIAGAGLFLSQLVIVDPLLDHPLISCGGFGFTAMLALVGIVKWEKSGKLTVALPLRFLGAASYSIYLTHGIAISIAIHFVTQVLSRDVSPLIPVLFLTAVGIVFGIVFHVLIERPLTRWTAA